MISRIGCFFYWGARCGLVTSLPYGLEVNVSPGQSRLNDSHGTKVILLAFELPWEGVDLSVRPVYGSTIRIFELVPNEDGMAPIVDTGVTLSQIDLPKLIGKKCRYWFYSDLGSIIFFRFNFVLRLEICGGGRGDWANQDAPT